MSVRVSLQNYFFLSSLFYFLGFSYSIHSHCGVLFVSHETGSFLRPAFLLSPRYHTPHKATANASAFFRDPRSRCIGLCDGVSAITSEPLKIRRQVKLGKKSFREIFLMSLKKMICLQLKCLKRLRTFSDSRVIAKLVATCRYLSASAVPKEF